LKAFGKGKRDKRRNGDDFLLPIGGGEEGVDPEMAEKPPPPPATNREKRRGLPSHYIRERKKKQRVKLEEGLYHLQDWRGESVTYFSLPVIKGANSGGAIDLFGQGKEVDVR